MDAEAAFFKNLADPTRLRLMVLLALRGETCVCELAGALGAPEYKVSRHLGVLRNGGLVEARREGAWMHYRLAEGRNDMEHCLQECFRVCLREHETVRADLARLEKLVCGKESTCCD